MDRIIIGKMQYCNRHIPIGCFAEASPQSAAMVTPEKARENLRDAILDAGEDFAAASRLIGKNHAYIQQYVKRGTPRHLQAQDIHILARHYRLDEAAIGGRSSPVQDDQYTSIAEYDVEATAGGGAINDREHVIGHLTFKTAWLKANTSASPEDLGVISVRGDSMEPFLHPGDHVLVDTSQTKPSDNGIFVIRSGDGIQIKRLGVNPVDQSVIVSSDNPAYPSFDFKRGELTVVGQVIWLGRRV